MLFCKHDLAYQIADDLAEPNAEWRKVLVHELGLLPWREGLRVMLWGFRIYNRRIAKRVGSGRASPNTGSREILRLLRVAKSDCKQRNWQKLTLLLRRISAKLRAIA